MNELHGRLDRFLEPCNGVSARWLHRYLWWFEWVWRARRAADARADLAELASAGTYVWTRAGLLGGDRPFYDYWKEMEGAASAA